MGLFNRHSKPTSLPGDIVSLMARFGRFEFDAEASGEDAGDMGTLIADLYAFSSADPAGFLTSLAEAVLPVDGWAVYGASRTLWELFGSEEVISPQHPATNAIMDAAIAFLRANRVSPMYVRGYEWEYWFARGGTRETWLPQEPSQTPESPEAWVATGDDHFEHARYTEALDACDRAIQLDSSYAPAYALKANLLAQIGQYEQSLGSFDQAVRLNPADAGSYACKGLALSALGRYEEALMNYDRAIQLCPTVAGGHADRADALSALGRHQEALFACDQAIQVNPGYARAYANKGTALAELKRYEEALTAYDRAFQLNPSDAGACAGKALMLSWLNRPDEALDAWNASLHFNPSDAMGHAYRGLALAALNRPADALAAYNRALQLDPGNALASAGKKTASSLKGLQIILAQKGSCDGHCFSF